MPNSRESEHRITFSSGDFVKIRGHDIEIMRLDLVLIYEAADDVKRAFFLVTDVIPLG